MEFVTRVPTNPNDGGSQSKEEHPLVAAWNEYYESRKASLRAPSEKAFCGHVKSTSSFLRTTFAGFESRAFGSVLGIFLFLTLYTILITVLYEYYVDTFKVPAQGLNFEFGAVTTTLSFLLVFRMSRAAVRWWDSRSFWGVIIAKSRDLATRVIAMPSTEPETVLALLKEIFLYAVSVRCFLRSTPVIYEDLKGVCEASRVEELNRSKHIFLTGETSLVPSPTH